MTGSRRPRLVAATASILAVGIAVLSLGVGDVPLPADRVLEILLGGGSAQEELIVLQLRLPRAVLALLIGLALGVSGAIVQTTARNALASPDLLGVTAGASAGAVAVIVLGGSGGRVAGVLRSAGIPVAAVVGGLLAAALVAAVLRIVHSGGVQPLLVGVGVSAFFGGLVSWMLIAADIDDAARANVWLTGSLNNRGWPESLAVAVVVVLVMLALAPLAARIPALTLGLEVARTLGVRTTSTVVALLVLSVLLVSAATAAAGPIAFVALVAPHLSRMLARASRAPLPAAGAIGAVLVVASDLLARIALAPLILPVGAVTAAIGAPFLLWLLVRRRTALR
ncbi:iron chelate uptake ABC transporter family permease subunit [Rathayibacter sp. VKM Ac-2803]|uniref:FecCD family ABC transporter permease n=1 Tax=Rathayibacter sp. VKM Ac-2803 TaxID=2609256 RepID=UPI00135B00C8|nr:iron chelate uptake ABC transporter family permease subunit [Rathayibacter sp. VKM Ac-2803]MWV51148.1 iron chelate uptake ABC transporter family permease subunit [Rathayibacter sp. VKM Ac-2803]